MTNNIAHELKTPVSSIRGYIETILEQEHLEPVKQKFFLERAYIQILRLSELIRDVALITKTEEASDLFEKETINIRTTIDEVTTDLEVSLQHNHIVVHNHIGPKVEIEGNHTLLYSIFRNLIDNAMEACEGIADPYIRLYIGVLKNQLYISVTNATKDTVRKLDSEYITTKRGNHGHGLKRINLVVEKYEGYINRQNEPGVFVTEIMLPL